MPWESHNRHNLPVQLFEGPVEGFESQNCVCNICPPGALKQQVLATAVVFWQLVWGFEHVSGLPACMTLAAAKMTCAAASTFFDIYWIDMLLTCCAKSYIGLWAIFIGISSQGQNTRSTWRQAGITRRKPVIGLYSSWQGLSWQKVDALLHMFSVAILCNTIHIAMRHGGKRPSTSDVHTCDMIMFRIMSFHFEPDRRGQTHICSLVQHKESKS